MVSRIIGLLIMGISTASYAERSDIIGNWEPLGSGHLAIYGSIEITEAHLEWGVMSEKYPCKASYELTKSEEKESFLFTLINKQCDYDHMQNGHYHKLLASFEFQVRENEQGELEAGFIDYDKSGKSIGEGSFYKDNDVVATRDAEVKVSDKESALESGRELVTEIKELSQYFGKKYITFRTVKYPDNHELQFDVARVYRNKVEFIANPYHPEYEKNMEFNLAWAIKYTDLNDKCFSIYKLIGTLGKEYSSIDEALRKEDVSLIVINGKMCAYKDGLILHLEIYVEELGETAESTRKYSTCEEGRYGGCKFNEGTLEFVIKRDDKATHKHFNAKEIAKIRKQMEWDRLFHKGASSYHNQFDNNKALLEAMRGVKDKCSANGYRSCAVICDQRLNALYKAGSHMSPDTREDYWEACVIAAARDAGVVPPGGHGSVGNDVKKTAEKQEPKQYTVGDVPAGYYGSVGNDIKKIAKKKEPNQLTVNEYAKKMQEEIQRKWMLPPSTDFGLSCVVEVRLTTDGHVIDVQIVQSSGSSAFDRSVEGTVFKASPLPMPPDPEVVELFRSLRFVFKPG